MLDKLVEDTTKTLSRIGDSTLRAAELTAHAQRRHETPELSF
jgi:hypothetical protein